MLREKIFPDRKKYFMIQFFYCQINFGDLKIPSHSTIQRTLFYFMVFNVAELKVYRNYLTNIFMLISDIFYFNMKREYGIISPNIFFNNYCFLSLSMRLKKQLWSFCSGPKILVFSSYSTKWQIIYVKVKTSNIYLPNPSTRAGCDTRSDLKCILTGINYEFSFSQTDCRTKLKEFILPTIYL